MFSDDDLINITRFQNLKRSVVAFVFTGIASFLVSLQEDHNIALVSQNIKDKRSIATECVRLCTTHCCFTRTTLPRDDSPGTYRLYVISQTLLRTDIMIIVSANSDNVINNSVTILSH